MKTLDILPSTMLAPFIKGYKMIETGSPVTNRIIPDISIALAFRYTGTISYSHSGCYEALPPFTLSGLRKTHRLINYTQHAGAIIVMFHTAAFNAFFNLPAHELFGKSISLAELLSHDVYEQLTVQFNEANTTHERIMVIEKFLIQRLAYSKQDQLIIGAVETIQKTNGLIRIKELVTSCYLSQDAFEKRFRKNVGASPKQFAAIVRMRSLLAHNKSDGLLDIAFSAGFYDQAHFNHEVKTFTGLTPTALFSSRAFW
ncbi:helix-turn-helix domain-containing protein [Chitinophaga rhizophila]|uniref:Helix-turn-helix domain-containing protein n=1 Tax=Chitinophaga rhizophila TaxID=2866212 RepID=A0ABS7G8C3_9BACT|nr:helix-turn-helix domain-containing protein [Chitinophaga rhizophila]MBW8683890.1 helix-turn-helix domain-containing protein [Chitinophaga rhizophila]